MKKQAWIFVLIAICAVAQTTEQRYKNIQVLKGFPADDLIPAMDFIDGSLGVQCSFCHGAGRFPEGYESDALKTKQTAREMMKMTRQINETAFHGRTVVSCATCHRGHTQPDSVTPLLTEETFRDRRASQTDSTSPLPSPAELFAKFAAAAGGDAAIANLTSRHAVATVTPPGGGSPAKIESFAKPPNLFVQETGGRKLGDDGQHAWISVPSPHALDGADAEGIHTTALFYRNLKPAGFYAETATLRKEKLGDKETFVVRGGLKGGRSADLLWFDADSGLLLRRMALTRTVFGETAQADTFENYRQFHGVKVAIDVTRSTAFNGPQRIHYDVVEFNVPIDEKAFAIPAK